MQGRPYVGDLTGRWGGQSVSVPMVDLDTELTTEQSDQPTDSLPSLAACPWPFDLYYITCYDIKIK